MFWVGVCSVERWIESNSWKFYFQCQRTPSLLSCSCLACTSRKLTCTFSLCENSDFFSTFTGTKHSQWGLCEYVIAHTILGGSPVILWISLGGKTKWLPLKFGYHDVMRTSPIIILFYLLFGSRVRTIPNVEAWFSNPGPSAHVTRQVTIRKFQFSLIFIGSLFSAI